MGFFSSDEENSEVKTVDTNGNVNNNIVIQEAADTHAAMITSERLLAATYMLVAAELLKIGVYIFHTVRRRWKKKYSGLPGPSSGPSPKS